MNIPEEYNRAGQPWEEAEDNQLVKEYTLDNLSVLELSTKHKRMPGGVASRLQHLNLITMRNQARGYLEYQQSDLYKTIVEYNRNNRVTKSADKRVKKSKKKKDVPPAKIEEYDIPQIKKDIADIKEDVSKILELIHAMYEFKEED